jgi:hypothetical protein
LARPPQTKLNRTAIHIWRPTIKGVEITSKEQLQEIINTEYPSLKRNSDFSNLHHDAKIHLDLITKLEGKEYLDIKTRNMLIDEFSISYRKMTNWAQAARQPRLYYLIENSISKTEAQDKINNIFQENNGIHDETQSRWNNVWRNSCSDFRKIWSFLLQGKSAYKHQKKEEN